MNPDPTTNILTYVLWSLVGLVAASVTALIWVIKNKNNSDAIHKTFADDPDTYWDRMRQIVTEPLSRILDKQTDILQELIRETVRIEERSRLRAEALTDKGK